MLVKIARDLHLIKDRFPFLSCAHWRALLFTSYTQLEQIGVAECFKMQFSGNLE